MRVLVGLSLCGSTGLASACSSLGVAWRAVYVPQDWAVAVAVDGRALNAGRCHTHGRVQHQHSLLRERKSANVGAAFARSVCQIHGVCVPVCVVCT